VSLEADVASAFKAAASDVSAPASPAPRPSKRIRRGGGGRVLTTAVLADSYLGLCHDPCNDLQRWMAEDKKHPGVRPRAPPPVTESQHESEKRTPSLVEDARGLCRRSLHHLQGGMDAGGNIGRIADDLPLGSRTCAGGHDELRPLRAEGRGNLGDAASDGSGEFASELGAVDGFFASRRAAIRNSTRPGEIAAALRALANEQTIARRNVMERWQAASRNAAERSKSISQHAACGRTLQPLRPALGQYRLG